MDRVGLGEHAWGWGSEHDLVGGWEPRSGEINTRVTEEVKSAPGRGSRRLIPALAYSAATVVLLSIISYYAFFRSRTVSAVGPMVAEETLKNNAQPTAQPTAQPNAQAPLARTELQQPLAKDQNAIPEKEFRDTRSIAGRTDKLKEYQSKTTAAGNGGKKDVREKNVRELTRPERDVAETRSPAKEQGKGGMQSNTSAAPSAAQSAAAAPSVAQSASAPPTGQSASAPPTGQSGSVSAVEKSASAAASKKSASAPAAEQSASASAADQSAVPAPYPANSATATRSVTQPAAVAPESTGVNLVAESESLVKAEVSKLKSEQPPDYSKYLAADAPEDPVRIERQLEIVTRQIDSLGVKDSVKLDSLRRLQKYLRIEQLKARARTPENARKRKPD